MRRTIQSAIPALTSLLLVSELFVGNVSSQTVDSLSVSNAETSHSSAPLIYTAIPLPDGRTLVGGTTIQFISSGGQAHTNLARLNSDGSVDDSFKASIPGTTYDSATINCVTLLTNGQILVGGVFSMVSGQSRYNIARLNADGTLDAGFNAGYMDGSVNGILVTPGGKILVCGSFTRINGTTCYGLCQLKNDGGLDPYFGAGANNSIMSVALQPDGRILAEGTFTSIGGQSRTNLARLNANGTIDASFQPAAFNYVANEGIGGFGGSVAVQPDGKIIVGGMFARVNGFSHTNIVRFNVDGTLDSGFNAQADLHDCWGLQTLTLQADGKILVGDDSLTLDGHMCPYLGRLQADGSMDPGFSTNLVSGEMVYSSVVQADGRILVAGWFGSLGGATRTGLGRLINTDAATQSLSFDGTNVVWLRGGTSPELWRAAFEASTNGTDWSYLGDGSHTNGGWQLSNVIVPAGATIRARGFIAAGRFNGSGWCVECVYPQAAPAIESSDGCLGFRSNQFGFHLCGSAGSTVVIEASSNLLDWSPVATNVLPGAPIYFSDPCANGEVRGFYRARLQE